MKKATPTPTPPTTPLTDLLSAGCGSVSLHPVTAWCGSRIVSCFLVVLAWPAASPTPTRWVRAGRVTAPPSGSNRPNGIGRGGRSGSGSEHPPGPAQPARPGGRARGPLPNGPRRVRLLPGHPVTSARSGSASTKHRSSRWAHLAERRPPRPRGCVLGPTRAALPVAFEETGGGGQLKNVAANPALL